VGIAAVMIAVGSLLLSDYAGAFDALWAWLTLAWGAAIIASTMRAREGVRTT
jgi:hypothetical protein